MYLLLSKINGKYPEGSPYHQPIIDKLKDIAFNTAFVSLSIIPLICAGLDVINFVGGVLGMALILILLSLLNNGR